MVHEYTNKLRAELTNLQEELQQESAVWQYQDEDIVAALN
jgi:argininosuccinate lyase